MKKNLESLASMLHKARVAALPVEQLTRSHTDLTRSDAYFIQELQFSERENLGEKYIGWKMGLTSEAKRRQMNLDSPLYGGLTDKMKIESGSAFQLAGSIHPKIEPEIAFLTSKQLKGNVTREEVLNSCSGVAAALEILDSRYDQFKYFSMEDVIADNSSSSHFVVGAWKSPHEVDLKNLKMEMFVNGQLAQSGVSSDISGDPAVSVMQLCQMLAERGKTLKAGSIVLAGAATAAVALEPGMKIELVVQSLEPVRTHVLEAR